MDKHVFDKVIADVVSGMIYFSDLGQVKESNREEKLTYFLLFLANLHQEEHRLAAEKSSESISEKHILLHAWINNMYEIEAAG